MSFFNSDMKTRELKVMGGTGTSGQIEIYDDSSSNKITLKVPSTVSDYTFTLPDTAGVEHQSLRVGAGGVLEFNDVVRGSERVIISVQNNDDDNATLTPGTPVYIKGYTSGGSGRLLVGRANNSNSSRMPAAGVVEATIAYGNNGVMVEQGEAFFDTSGSPFSGFSIGESLFVNSTTGLLTNVKPIGSNKLIQNIARMGRINTDGFIIVTGPSRTNDVPNLADSNIWIGADGYNTRSYAISQDISLSNTAVATINSISNTSTISSSANITMSDNKHLYFGDTSANIYGVSGTSNLNLSASNITLSTHTICSNTFTLTRTNGGTISGNTSIALDFDKSSDFHYTLSAGANVTLNNPTNVNRVGQTGSIILETPSTLTTHQLNWARGGSSKWYFPAGIAPSISETNSVIDVFSYLVVASDKILVNDGVNFQQYTA